MSLKDKNILLGICGGIAAYKSCDIIRELTKLAVNTKCILTENGEKFITPLTIQTLSKNKVYSNMFEKLTNWEIGHISLAKFADLILVAPATANIIAKLACGAADDMLSCCILASKAKILICPSMNLQMFEHKATQKNIETLKDFGYDFVMPQIGELACGDVGRGKLAATGDIIEKVKMILK
jgi:phosphopantothenoylcysteine synthetase/decarboxylase